MKFRFALLCLLLIPAISSAGDGIPARASAADYPAHQVSGKVAIGAAFVPPAQVRKLFGEDLDRHGYVVFEVGVFPLDTSIDVSADDFKLHQGKDPSILRAATPHQVAADVYPRKTQVEPKTPGKVNVETVDAIGYERGSNGQRGVYTRTDVGVGIGTPPSASAPPPPPPQAGGNDQAGLERKLDDQSLPETKTAKPVAGYVYFPKPAADKRADFELVYFGADGPVTLKLSPSAK